MKNRKNKKGFTIVELVIVIGVIGILSAILIPTFVSLTAKAETASLKSNLANAYSMYAAVAADRKVDKDEFADAAEKETIEFVSQDKVQLVKGTENYVYAAGEWKSGSLSGSGTLSPVGASEAHSTFNGYVVKYLAN